MLMIHSNLAYIHSGVQGQLSDLLVKNGLKVLKLTSAVCEHIESKYVTFNF